MLRILDIITSLFWHSLPTILTFIAMIASISNVGMHFITPLTPAFLLGSLFFWRIYRRRILPYWLILLFGILVDSLCGTPIGVSSTILILAAMIVDSQREVLLWQQFIIIWVMFILFTVAYSLAVGFLLSIYYSMDMSFDGFLHQQITSFFIYPTIHFVMMFIYKKVAR